jgi:hypothetical protein
MSRQHFKYCFLSGNSDFSFSKVPLANLQRRFVLCHVLPIRRFQRPLCRRRGAGSIAKLILIFVQHPADRLQQFVSG